MGAFIRFLLYVLLGVLVFRLLKSLFREKERGAKVKGRPSQKADPFEGADIQDVKFTELPSEETKEEKNSKDD